MSVLNRNGCAALFMIAMASLARAMPTTPDATPEHDACVEAAFASLANAQVGDHVLACGGGLVVSDIKPGNPGNTATDGLVERDCISRSTTAKQAQVVASGTWWDVWAEDSGCNYCQLSGGACHAQINWSDTTTWSSTVGFDLGTTDIVLGSIKGNAGLNYGYTWGKSYTKGGSWTCDINPGDVGRVYVQNQKGWSDSIVREVTHTFGCGLNIYNYGPWTGKQHANWALDGDNTKNLGCSTGANAHC